MADKKVKGGFEVPSKPKKYTRYDGVARPRRDKQGADGEYKELGELIPELSPENLRAPKSSRKK
jgi:hypothetical protein